MTEESPESKLARMDERMDRFRHEIETVKATQREQRGDMKAIASKLDTLTDTISRGQWIILGAAGFFMLQSMGLSEFLKKLLT